MIKLILSDVDGTLLEHGQKSLPDKVFDTVEQLYDRGIMFAAASGRGYCDLKELFAPVKDKMAFVCSDGALTLYRNNVLGCNSMDREKAIKLMWDIRNMSGCEYLLYGRDKVYASPKTRQYEEFLNVRYGSDYVQVKSPSGVNDEFLKVAVYDGRGVKECSEYFTSRWSDSFNKVYDSNVWMEFVAGGISKAKGVEALCRHFDVRQEEVMAFGDGANDLELFSVVADAYAKECAPEHIKSVAGHQTKDVIETIRRKVLNEG